MSVFKYCEKNYIYVVMCVYFCLYVSMCAAVWVYVCECVVLFVHSSVFVFVCLLAGVLQDIRSNPKTNPE